MRRASLLILLICQLFSLKAEKYFVYLTDKDGMSLDPYEYFHTNTLKRRERCGLPLVQQSDLPVREDYIAQVAALSDSITVVSRWFNMLCVHTEIGPDQLEALRCVERVEKPLPIEAQLSMIDTVLGSFYEALRFYQTERMEASVFKKRSINGEGVVVAVIDAGFRGMNNHDAFKQMQVLKTWDFVRKDDNPFRGSTHGASVAACIGGSVSDDSIFFGLAPNAQYLLARSERAFSEKAAEEEYWLAAAEWADKNGADVINSSLGYTQKRYQIEEMDGTTALVSRAAKMAFQKGIVVVVSAGNEGSESWKYISAPADVDSVVSVGGIDPYTDLRSSFSSYGPNANAVTKPNVCAYGSVVMPKGSSGTLVGKGTSFASPLVAGFVACLLQAFPEDNQHQVFERLQKSGHLYPYFDFAHGYGIPQASAMFPKEEGEPQELYHLKEQQGFLYLEFTEHFLSTYPDEERRRQLNIYLHIKNAWGQVIFYGCYRDLAEDGFLLYIGPFDKGNEVMVHFEGYTKTHIIQE